MVLFMCRVKVGNSVVSNSDLQNLVTSVILRQTSTFSVEDITGIIKRMLIGSSFQDTAEVAKRCEKTISVLYLNDCLRTTESGQYKLTMSFPSVTGR